MKMSLVGAATIAAAVCSSASHAQQATTPAGSVMPGAAVMQAVPAPAAAPVPLPVSLAAPAPSCEMHIWPAARVSAVTQGAGSMFGLLGMMIDAASNANRNKRDKAFITAALDPAAQARALREMDLPTTLALPPSTVITHDEGIELTSDMAGRLTKSAAPCYYDVVIRQLSYVKTAMTKGKMRTFIAIRGANGNTQVVDYKDSANHALDVKLPEEAEDATVANRALIDAFKADVTEFSAKFVRKKSAADFRISPAPRSGRRARNGEVAWSRSIASSLAGWLANKS